MRVLRWTLLATGLIVASYVAWVGVAIIRLESAIISELPPTPTHNTAAANGTSTAAAEAGIIITPSATPDPLRKLPKERINILVLGTDKRPNDEDHFPRSDTLLLVNLDTISSTARIMSIPRDLIMDVPGYGENKVNSAYLFGEYYKEPGGGQALSVQTVSRFFDVPIDYYVTVNFEGFRTIVDTIGGVSIYVPYEIDDYHYPSDDEGDPFGERHVHFDEGWQRMDGKEALRYARTRHADNDFMRSKRQLQIITSLRKEVMSMDILPVLPELLEDLAGMMETNIPFDKQLALVQFGYNIEPSSIITTSIDRSLIIPTIMPDGSEGMELDEEAAQPVLDEFFGRKATVKKTPTAFKEKRATVTPKPRGTVKRPTATPALSGTKVAPSTTPRSPTPTRKP